MIIRIIWKEGKEHHADSTRLWFFNFFLFDGPSGTGQNASKAGSCNDTQLMKGNKKLEKKNLLPNIFLKNEWKTKMKGLDWWPVPPTQFLQIYLNAEIRVRGSFFVSFPSPDLQCKFHFNWRTEPVKKKERKRRRWWWGARRSKPKKKIQQKLTYTVSNCFPWSRANHRRRDLMGKNANWIDSITTSLTTFHSLGRDGA